MPSTLPKQFAATELTTAFVDQYTVAANNRISIKACAVTNKSTSARYVTATVASSTGTARHVAYQLNIPAGRTMVLPGMVNQSFDAGWKITALSQATTSLDFVMSGSITTLSP